MKNMGYQQQIMPSLINTEAAKDYLDKEKFPIVLKADGLAFGKGVIIAHDKVSAQNSLENMMLSKVFGDAANTVIIEEFLEGPEMTLLCFTDGKTVSAMPSAKIIKSI